jgi:hypothetical protein
MEAKMPESTLVLGTLAPLGERAMRARAVVWAFDFSKILPLSRIFDECPPGGDV